MQVSAVQQTVAAPRKAIVSSGPWRSDTSARWLRSKKNAFPTQFPPTSFQRELRSKVARYLVAARVDVHGHPSPALPPLPEHQVEPVNGPLLNRLVRGARGVWRRHAATWRPGEELVTGFVGLWYVADEAHIVSIGVRSEYRGLGLGEMLLISAIEQARQMKSKVMTLEVRISNHVAQNLYKKIRLHQARRAEEATTQTTARTLS